MRFRGQVYLANAFSLGMLSSSHAVLSVHEISLTEARYILKNQPFISAIGHESTAKVLSQLLGMEIIADRSPIKLNEGDVLIVFQLLERLPEGKVLSEEELRKLKYKFYKVEILV